MAGRMCLAVLALSASVHRAPATVHTVHFEASKPVWTVGLNVAFPDIEIALGDTLNFVSFAFHDVALVHSDGAAPWSKCTMKGIATDQITSIFGVSEFRGPGLVERQYTPPACGEYFIACSVMMHCAYGQRFKLTVANADGSVCTSPCAHAACVTADSKKAVDDHTKVHAVVPTAPASFWGEGPYAALTVSVGDSVEFHTFGGMYDVATVPTLTAFNSCDMARRAVRAEWKMVDMAPSTQPTDACTSSAGCCKDASCGSSGNGATFTFTAAAAGEVYFVSSKDGMSGEPQCKLGQKLKLIVVGAGIANGTTTVPPSVSTAFLSEVSSSVVALVASIGFLRGLCT